jgi:hypothetical protein
MADLATQLRAFLADTAADLPPADVAAALAAELERLRWQTATTADADDCECLDAEAVAGLLKCSVDLIRQRGEEWGIAKVLARDSRGRPSRVVYPKALLRAYLGGTAGEGACATSQSHQRRTARR